MTILLDSNRSLSSTTNPQPQISQNNSNFLKDNAIASNNNQINSRPPSMPTDKLVFNSSTQAFEVQKVVPNEETSSSSWGRGYTGIMLRANDLIPRFGETKTRNTPPTLSDELAIERGREFLKKNPRFANFVKKIPAGASVEIYFPISPSEFFKAPADLVIQVKLGAVEKFTGYSAQQIIADKIISASVDGKEKNKFRTKLHNFLEIPTGIKNDLRFRFSISSGDIIKTFTDIDNGKGFWSSILDNATVGLNYLKVLDVNEGKLTKVIPSKILKKLPAIDGSCAYIQMRFVPENSLKKEGNDNASNVYFVVGFETGDIFNVTPSLEMLGWNAKIVPTFDKMTKLESGERVYIAEVFDQQYTLDPKYTSIIDTTSGKDIEALLASGKYKLIDNPNQKLADLSIDDIAKVSPVVRSISNTASEISKFGEVFSNTNTAIDNRDKDLLKKAMNDSTVASFRSISATGSMITTMGASLVNSGIDYFNNEIDNLGSSISYPSQSIKGLIKNTEDLLQDGWDYAAQDLKKNPYDITKEQVYYAITDAAQSSGKSLINGIKKLPSINRSAGEVIQNAASFVADAAIYTSETASDTTQEYLYKTDRALSKLTINDTAKAIDSTIWTLKTANEIVGQSMIDSAKYLANSTIDLVNEAIEYGSNLLSADDNNKQTQLSQITPSVKPNLAPKNQDHNKTNAITTKTAKDFVQKPAVQELQNQKTTNKEPSSTQEKQYYQEYFVQKGDTLSDLSKQYNISVEKLQIINNIDNPDLIITGDSLLVPYGVMQ